VREGGKSRWREKKGRREAKKISEFYYSLLMGFVHILESP